MSSHTESLLSDWLLHHPYSERAYQWLLHDTPTYHAGSIADRGRLCSRKSDDHYYDGKLARTGAPKVVWLKASFEGLDISLYPRPPKHQPESKRRFLMPANHINLDREENFHMFFVNKSTPRLDLPNKCLQVHILFIRPDHERCEYCTANFEKLDRSTFPLLRWDAPTRQWMGPAQKVVSLPDAANVHRMCTVNVAIAGDVPWTDGLDCKRLADVSHGRPIPSVVRAPRYGEETCRSCLLGEPCEKDACNHLHDNDGLDEAPGDAAAAATRRPAEEAAVWQ